MLKEGVLIRRMRQEDIPAVTRIDRLSFPIPWSERTYQLEIADNPAAHLFVAAEQGRGGETVIGYAGFWYIVDEAHISTLAVHPDHRRRGVGERLLQTCLEEAAKLGAELVSLEVRISNAVAIRLYEKYGFLEHGRKGKYYHDNDEDALVMLLTDMSAWRRQESGGFD